MVGFRGSPAAVALAALPYFVLIGALRWATWFSTPVELPEYPGGELRITAGWPTVHLTRDGQILYEGKSVSLRELAEALRQEHGEPEDERLVSEFFEPFTRRPLLLCIDRGAPVLHATWLFQAVGNAGFNRVHVGVQGPAGAAVLPMTLITDWWGLPWEPDWGVGAATTPDDLGVFSLWVEDEGLRTDPDSKAFVDDWLRKWRRPPLAKVQVKTSLSFQRVVAAFAKARAAGFLHVEWGHQGCPPWIEGRKRLPQPETEDAYMLSSHGPFPWGNDLRQLDLADLLLPPANHARTDRDNDPDDRIVLNLDSKGQLLFRNVPRTLDETAVIISDAKRIYNLKMRAKGKKGYVDIEGIKYTRLFGLVRAHKDTPWQHVAWLLATLSSKYYYKVQFAATLVPDDRYDEEECRRLGFSGRRRVPTTWGFRGKLGFTLLEPEESTPLHVAADGTYRLADKETSSPETLHSWLKGARGPVKVSADPATAHKFVIAAVNQVKRADRAFAFDFGILPGAEIMRKHTLPPPR